MKELDELPHNLDDMPSIKKVKNWYCQSFEVSRQSCTFTTQYVSLIGKSAQELINFPKFHLTPELKRLLYPVGGGPLGHKLPESIPNPSLHVSVDDSMDIPFNYSNVLHSHIRGNGNGNGNGNAAYASSRLRIPMERRYYAEAPTTMSWPPELHDYNRRFTRLLEAIKRRHDPTVTTVAQGVLEWKKLQPSSRAHIGLDVQAWLDRFYMSRIGIRFLIGQHVALNTLEPHPDYVGIICTRANVHDIVHEAIENARFVCEEHYGMFRGPTVQLICAPELSFAYVPGHLSHICFELLKNSLRAVVERYGPSDPEVIPAIKVIVSEGKEDITIKISDEGGGIPRSAIPLIWTYMYTTMQGQGLAEEFTDTDFKAPMAGFGYGLPLSRLVSEPISRHHLYTPFVSPRPPLSSLPSPTTDFVPKARIAKSTWLDGPVKPTFKRANLNFGPMAAVDHMNLNNVHVHNNNKNETNVQYEDSRKAMMMLTPNLYRSLQYARYFGGDLKLISMEGYGTDVYIHLNRLSSSREPLQ